MWNEESDIDWQKIRFHILQGYGQLLNCWFHWKIMSQLNAPMQTVHNMVRELPEAKKQIIEQQYLKMDGFFEFLLSLKELPQSMEYLMWFATLFTVASAWLAFWALFKLYDREHWAYVFVWSISLCSIVLGLMALNPFELFFGLYGCYVMYENRDNFIKEEHQGDN